MIESKKRALEAIHNLHGDERLNVFQAELDNPDFLDDLVPPSRQRSNRFGGNFGDGQDQDLNIEIMMNPGVSFLSGHSSRKEESSHFSRGWVTPGPTNTSKTVSNQKYVSPNESESQARKAQVFRKEPRGRSEELKRKEVMDT